MLGKWLSVVVAALAVSLLAPVAVQGAEEESPALPGPFQLHASNGYGLLVLAGDPAGREDGSVALFLASRHAGVSYVAPATVTDKTIEADLGKLGEISLALVPTGRMRSVPWGCKPGARKRVEVERYEGSIEFHGEEGFTEVSATSAPLDYKLLQVLRCPSGFNERRAISRKHSSGARLDVEKDKIDKYRVEFDAIQEGPGARTAVSVEVEEHRGEMEIHRATWTLASAGALRYDQRLRTATVAPPAPFAGHARFQLNARRLNQWTGNLSVDFPGNSDVPLTGPGFGAALEHPRR